MHKDWCGEDCNKCGFICTLDLSMVCRPNCMHLGLNGERDSIICSHCELSKKKNKGNFLDCIVMDDSSDFVKIYRVNMFIIDAYNRFFDYSKQKNICNSVGWWESDKYCGMTEVMIGQSWKFYKTLKDVSIAFEKIEDHMKMIYDSVKIECITPILIFNSSKVCGGCF